MPDHEDVQQMAKGWPSIDVDINEFPNVKYPEVGTKEYQDELLTLQKSFLRPSCSNKFLEISNEKPFKIFKKYVEKNNLDYDMNYLDTVNKDLAGLVLTLKFKYNRPRPYKQMERSNVEFPYNRIEINDSPSFPSGHSAHAFFNAKMIASKFPEHEMKLRTLAEMISQSRLDLGKHYSSDVSFGKFVGEYCAQKIKNKKSLTENIDKLTGVNNLSREIIKNAEFKHNSNNTDTTYLDELCEFLIRSNEIERYTISIDEALTSAKCFLNGLPVKYCTNNKYIRSHLNALVEASHYTYVDTVKKICSIHKEMGTDVLERGEAGMLRDYKHFARSTGHAYSNPDDILNDLASWCTETKDLDPFLRHIKYECIHPFNDGNGRSGRIILAADLNFDLKALNNLIGQDYIPKIVSYQDAMLKQ